LKQKSSDFSEIMVCPHGRGCASADILRARWKSIFCDFMRTFFMDGPLSTWL